MATMATQAAPGDLEIVRAFLNTLDVEGDVDRLAHAEDAVAWLGERGLLGQHEQVGGEGLGLLRSLREALRTLAAEGDGEARDVLNAVAQSVGLTVRFGAGARPRFVATAGGVRGAAGRLLAVVAGAMTDGTWQRLKLCDNDRCGWAFYDHSRNRSGRWCTMAVCGNRMKARAYRRRQGS